MSAITIEVPDSVLLWRQKPNLLTIRPAALRS